MNDFNASVPVRTTITRDFVTTWKYASVRAKAAIHDNEAEFVYLEVDDFAAACAVLCEHAGICLPDDPINRALFATNALPITKVDSFHRFLRDFHGKLSTCASRLVCTTKTQEVQAWVRQHLLMSPEAALASYSVAPPPSET